MSILRFPHPILTRKTEPWDFSQEDSRAKLLIMSVRMLEILDNTPHGVALAANQIEHRPWRFFAVKYDFATNNGLKSLIVNPVVSPGPYGSEEDTEGCLSFPGFNLKVRRARNVLLTYQDIDGEKHVEELSGFPARMVQHEVEHLDGKTFLENIPRIDRFRVMAEMKKRKVAGLA